MNQEFVANALCVDDEALVAIGTETENFANESITTDFDRSESTLRIERQRARPRRQEHSARSNRTAQKVAPIRFEGHGTHRLRRFASHARKNLRATRGKAKSPTDKHRSTQIRTANSSSICANLFYLWLITSPAAKCPGSARPARCLR